MLAVFPFSLCCVFKGSGEVSPRPGIVELRIFTADFLTGVMSVVFSFCANTSIMKNRKFLKLILLASLSLTLTETLEAGRALAFWPRRSQTPWRCENYPRASSVEVSCVLVRCAGLVIHDVCVSRIAFSCCLEVWTLEEYWQFIGLGNGQPRPGRVEMERLSTASLAGFIVVVSCVVLLC